MGSRLHHRSPVEGLTRNDGSAQDRVRQGDRLASLALASLLGVVVAAAALVFWQLYMQTSDLYNEPERIYGWGALGRDLPAYSLVLLPVAIGMSLGTRSMLLGSRRGRLAAGVNAVVLLGVVFMVLDGAVHEVARSAPGWVIWPLFVAAAVIAGFGLHAASRSARAHAGTERPIKGIRLASRHGGAVVLALIGLVASLGWLAIAQASLSAHASGFVRADLPGTVRVAVSKPGTYYVYAEKSAADAPEGLTVEAVSPSGSNLAVHNFAGTPAYLHEMRGARPVASFSAAMPGTYRVSASVSPLYPRGSFAVGPSVAGWMTPGIWGADVVLLAMLSLATWVEIRSARRDRREYQARGPAAGVSGGQ